jgi:rod shape determining protein RodA
VSFLEYRVKFAPTGIRKVLYMNWPLVVLVTAVASVGFLMLYSIAGGNIETWARPQMERFGVGMVLMFMVALTPIWFWRSMSGVAYVVAFLLLIVVEFFGTVGMGAQRWIDLGFIRLQPSEMMKFTLVMLLAVYYDWLDPKLVSRPLYVLLPVLMIVTPTVLVLMQPNLGTSLMLLLAGATVMFAAGVSLWYFGAVIGLVVGVVVGVFNIIQAKIALGSGGWSGKGFMQGTQSRLNFLPEKHTDFIFTTLAEEFGFVGAFSLLGLYALILGFCLVAAWQNRDRFSSLLIVGVAANFFFYIAVNLSMVMGMAPVVGVPLPLLSYGGSAMMVLLVGFGLVQSAHVHRPR